MFRITSRLARPACTALPLTALLALSCQGPADWRDQLIADSPCYRVNLLDGLDEPEPAERDDLFACLDDDGHLEPFVPAWRSMNVITRTGRPAGAELAATLNASLRSDVDLLGLAGRGAKLFRDQPELVEQVVDVALELGWAVPAASLRLGLTAPTDAARLESGALLPLGRQLPRLAGITLDHPELPGRLADALEAQETRQLVLTLNGVVTSPDPRAQQLAARALPALGESLPRFTDASNNRFASPSGDSLRDLLDAFTAGQDPLISQLSPTIVALTGDPTLRANAEATLLQLSDDRDLDQLLAQVAWMASVDRQGGTLTAGEDSSLHSFLRLVSSANAPVDCELDLWVTSLTWQIPNLAVVLLDLLADQDPDTVRTGLGLLGDVLGWPLSDTILYEVADTGICPNFTRQMMDDLDAVDVMYEPQAQSVLRAFLGTTHAIKHADQNRIPALVDAADLVYRSGATPRLEEFIRDLANSPADAWLMNVIPLAVHPEGYGVSTGLSEGEPLAAVPPLDLDQALALSARLLAASPDGTAWDQLAPLAQPLLGDERTWLALHRAGALAADPLTQTSRLQDLLPGMVALDPELSTLADLAPVLRDPALVQPALSVAERPELADALFASSPAPDQAEVPAAYLGRLAVGGALDDLLQIIDLALATID